MTNAFTAIATVSFLGASQAGWKTTPNNPIAFVHQDVGRDSLPVAGRISPSTSLSGGVNVTQRSSAEMALIGGRSMALATVEEKLDALADVWRKHNSGRSVVDYHHISHLQIIRIGPSAVPLLLRRIGAGDARWFYALKCITGIQAESSDMLGDADAVASAWIEWGRQNGLI